MHQVDPMSEMKRIYERKLSKVEYNSLALSLHILRRSFGFSSQQLDKFIRLYKSGDIEK